MSMNRRSQTSWHFRDDGSVLRRNQRHRCGDFGSAGVSPAVSRVANIAGNCWRDDGATKPRRDLLFGCIAAAWRIARTQGVTLPRAAPLQPELGVAERAGPSGSCRNTVFWNLSGAIFDDARRDQAGRAAAGHSETARRVVHGADNAFGDA